MINIRNKCCTAFVQVIFEDADHEDLTPAVVNAGLWIDPVPQLKRNQCLLYAMYLNELSKDTYNYLRFRMVQVYDTVDFTLKSSEDEVAAASVAVPFAIMSPTHQVVFNESE